MTERIEKLAEQLAQKLLATGFKIATAESCTGGGLSYWITSISGSSNWFERGFVTYTNEAKIEMLGVDPDGLARYGAVSAETARDMVGGVLRNSTAQIAVAITGIAGPTGGSHEKPVGLVWIAWQREDMNPETKQFQFEGDRLDVRSQAIEHALNGLVRILY